MKALAISLFTSYAVLLTGCTSTTSLGTFGAERKQLMIIPEKTWNNMANHSYQKFQKKAKKNSVYLEDPRLNQILARLAPQAQTNLRGDRTINWHINGNLSSKPNAHAFSSGQIVVSSSAYMFQNLSDDELATLISHEMAHVIRDHSREKASVFAATNLGLMGATMGAGSALGLASGLGGNFGVSMPHHRHIEEEADLIGLDLMVRAGYQPKAALSFWDKFEANLNKRKVGSKLPEFLSDHPNNESRKQALQAQVIAVESQQKDKLLAAAKRSSNAM